MTQQGEIASVVIDTSASRADVRASDADRDAVASVLGSAFAEGRLTAEEHAERVRAAYGAVTLGDLSGLTADLPGTADDLDEGPASPVPAEMDRCLLCMLLICCPPLGIALLLSSRRRGRRSEGAGAAYR